MTNAQKEALEALEAIECQMAEKGSTCKGPWCSARKKVLESFTSLECFEVQVPEKDDA